jgi:hypothetical protein
VQNDSYKLWGLVDGDSMLLQHVSIVLGSARQCLQFSWASCETLMVHRMAGLRCMRRLSKGTQLSLHSSWEPQASLSMLPLR